MSRAKGFNYKGFCERCGKLFFKAYRQPHQRFCGSARNKIGCSYKNQLILSKKWASFYPKRTKEISRDWWRKKRKTLPENFRGTYKTQK